MESLRMGLLRISENLDRVPRPKGSILMMAKNRIQPIIYGPPKLQTELMTHPDVDDKSLILKELKFIIWLHSFGIFFF